jgi:hypothetical protein
MAKQALILGLDDYQLSPTDLRRLGGKSVRFSVQLTGIKLSTLLHLRPKRRDAKLRATLKQQFQRLDRLFPEADLKSRDRQRGSWTLDGTLPARRIGAFTSRPEVQDVTIQSIDGKRRILRRPTLGWFCVWGLVAIQIEGRTKGKVDIEDRLVLVKAYNAKDARRRLGREWAKYAMPYLNPHGYLVRWQLVSVRDVYPLMQDELDPRGTEVYSRLRTEKMKPAYRWLPRFQSRRKKVYSAFHQ